MKKFLLLAGTVTLLALTGCARFTTTQNDTSYENGQPTRTITTRATASTFYESGSALANFKAGQTDKSQTATVGSLNQTSSSTNSAALVRAIVELLNAMKTP